ncbi:hypothetical protein OH492_03525 [Vibrio chagasii]|nr:hypothetical protein [Vibrio chagasii]
MRLKRPPLTAEASDVYFHRTPKHTTATSVFAARATIVAEFEELGLLTKSKIYDLTVPYGRPWWRGYRTNAN